MSTKQSYIGRCFCGAVELTVSGEPAAMGYCHCASCRHWSAGPVNAFTLWKPEAVAVTRGAAYVGHYNKTPASCRKWCTLCGGHLFTEHPCAGLIDVFAAVLEKFEHKPAFHVHYRETVLGMKDGLSKFSDLPTEAGDPVSASRSERRRKGRPGQERRAARHDGESQQRAGFRQLDELGLNG